MHLQLILLRSGVQVDSLDAGEAVARPEERPAFRAAQAQRDVALQWRVVQHDPQPLRGRQHDLVDIFISIAEQETSVGAGLEPRELCQAIEAVPLAFTRGYAELIGRADPRARALLVALAGCLEHAASRPALLCRCAVAVYATPDTPAAPELAAWSVQRAVKVPLASSVEHTGPKGCADQGLGAGELGIIARAWPRGQAEPVDAEALVAACVLLALRGDAGSLLADPLAKAVLVRAAGSRLLASTRLLVAALRSFAVLVACAGGRAGSGHTETAGVAVCVRGTEARLRAEPDLLVADLSARAGVLLVADPSAAVVLA